MQLQRAMATEAEAAREARAKVITGYLTLSPCLEQGCQMYKINTIKGDNKDVEAF